MTANTSNIADKSLQCSYQTQYQTMKEVEINHTLSIISGSNTEHFMHIEPNLPVCL